MHLTKLPTVVSVRAQKILEGELKHEQWHGDPAKLRDPSQEDRALCGWRISASPIWTALDRLSIQRFASTSTLLMPGVVGPTLLCLVGGRG